ncbi:hypothetical protein CRG98_009578 [Punica granatum]|uniref:fructose-bisphosphate aldolase n=1 Tax=Punica granatum TaxID=22663 RepID=A0A2I0KNB4_PUNGR|nr:hypothetical protein CRG98_009578 [Punica granatum]
MASASLLKSSPVLDKSEWIKGQSLRQPSVSSVCSVRAAWSALTVRASSYADELVKTAYISGAILFEETLYQSTIDGRKMVDVLVEQNIVPGIKLTSDLQGLVPLAGSNNESWCQGLDGLASRSAAYYQQGARFAKWRTVVTIPNGPSTLTVKEAAWGLARYAAISQVR